MATKQIVGYVVVDLSAGRAHVGEPFLPRESMAAQNEMRRLNREAGTNRYVVDAILAG